MIMMKNFAMIFFALVLLLAIALEADGERFNRLDPKLFSDQQQATTSSIGRKADVGTKDSTATAASLVASAYEEEDVNQSYGQYGRDTDRQGTVHRPFINSNNAYAPKPKKP
ncbi:hypothetical protein REPUB_Repub20aG0141500 [Reevesia pubescens]